MGQFLSSFALPFLNSFFMDEDGHSSYLVSAQIGQARDEYRVAIDSPELPGESRERHLDLYRAAVNGDWNIAEEILEEYPEDIRVPISKGLDTALHIASVAKHTHFVKALIIKMRKEDLGLQNRTGNTALCLAATSGVVEVAKLMLDEDQDLAKKRGSKNMLPLHMAALFGHRNMVNYLYKATHEVLNLDDRIELLVTLIYTELYDIALQLVKQHPELATTRDGSEETALHALARKPLESSDFASQNQQGVLKRWLNLFSGVDMIYKKKLHLQEVELIQLLWRKVILLSDERVSRIIGHPWRLIFVAAEQGNVEFLTILIREYPDLIWKVDDNRYTIFHIAILNRHEDIFKIIHEIGSIKDLIAAYKDEGDNNMLHLAGMSPPSNRLNIVSGAALQMQRELLWFKEVRRVVQPLYAEEKNKKNMTPRALFTESHQDLIEKGEKWMKDTATSCMLVAALIATVVFAAAFTLPGGNDDTGLPIFLKKPSFKIFAISNAISLMSSSTSILSFLSILTSRYAEQDFLWLLPLKLVIGLTTLFVSVAAMMVVFCASFFIFFQNEILGITILIVIAFIPIFLFIWQHHRLYVDVLWSIYRSGSMFKPNNVLRSTKKARRVRLRR